MKQKPWTSSNLRWRRPRVDESWKERAACQWEDPELFFPTKADRPVERGATKYRIKTAKKICAGCPVVHDCLMFAITVDLRYGIWGGLTEVERYRITGKRPA